MEPWQAKQEGRLIIILAAQFPSTRVDTCTLSTVQSFTLYCLLKPVHIWILFLVDFIELQNIQYTAIVFSSM